MLERGTMLYFMFVNEKTIKIGQQFRNFAPFHHFFVQKITAFSTVSRLGRPEFDQFKHLLLCKDSTADAAQPLNQVFKNRFDPKILLKCHPAILIGTDFLSSSFSHVLLC